MLKPKTVYRNGSTHIILTPIEFTLRLAVLVSMSRPHLIRFHGMQASNAKLRVTRAPRSVDRCTPAAHLAQADRLEWPRSPRRAFGKYWG